jgi:hypothetical protein
MATMRRFDACVNMCVVFADLPATQHLPAYKHSHHTYCPKCGEDRRTTPAKKVAKKDAKKDANEKGKPRRTVYWFPAKHWLKALWANKELAALMRQPANQRATGSVPRFAAISYVLILC